MRSAARSGRMRRMTEARAQRLETTLRSLSPSSPKRQPTSNQRWFDYYAGYADVFVDDIIGALAGHATTVLDPWNGAGTTTAAAAKAGFRTIGLDINPAAVVIAKARLLMSDVAASLLPLTEDVITHARHRRDLVDKSDLLLRWLDPATATSVRRLERSISALMVSSDGCRITEPCTINEVSSLAALFYLALFRTTRDLLAPFFASNPTWIRLRVDPVDRERIAIVDPRQLPAQPIASTPTSRCTAIVPSPSDSRQTRRKNGSLPPTVTSPPIKNQLSRPRRSLS
jgi:hypothetical protein